MKEVLLTKEEEEEYNKEKANKAIKLLITFDLLLIGRETLQSQNGWCSISSNGKLNTILKWNPVCIDDNSLQ